LEIVAREEDQPVPTYQYACRACGYEFEIFESITTSPVKICPKCKRKKVKRLISAGGGFIFRGKGFYSTDYRKESSKPDPKEAKSKEEKESK
jgi:putative FmdB family regulatory protein